MKRSKTYCAIISLIITIILQICIKNIIHYNVSLLIITSLCYFTIFAVATESIFNILKKENIKFNISFLVASLSGILVMLTMCIGKQSKGSLINFIIFIISFILFLIFSSITIKIEKNGQ